MFLLPLFFGFGVGIFLFSKVVNYFISTYEMYTRYLFLGLVVGTVPIFYKEVKKEGFSNKYYIYMAIAFIFGIILFLFNKGLFPTVINPNLIQSVILGIAVAGSTIVPGIDSAVILSSLGLYEIYVSSIANLNFSILLPAGIGLMIGAIFISFIINKLIKNYYTATFSIIFGLFLSIIPSVLNQNCYLGFNVNTALSIGLFIIGFLISTAFDNLKNNKEFSKTLLKYIKKIKTILGKKVID